MEQKRLFSYMDWYISINDYQTVWKNQPSFLMAQSLYLFGGVCTLKHAISNGHQWLSLWIVIVVNGFAIEAISLFSEDVSNFWHSQGPVMLLDRRLPLGIVFLYPCMYYISMVCISMLNIQKKFEPFAAGLFALLINVPCDVVGIKYLHWNLHNSDPNTLERSHSVPWNNFTFHFLFSASICYVSGSMTKKKFAPERSESLKYFISGVVMSIPLFIMSMAVFYHPLHDVMKIHSQTIFLIMFSSSCAFLWRGIILRKKEPTLIQHKNINSTFYLKIYLFLHFFLFVAIAIFSDPKQQISNSLHQPIGDCNATESIRTLLGLISPTYMLQRKRYLCWEHHNQIYFDFHCIPNFKPDNEIMEWYTICGTSHENKAEFISTLIGVSFTAYVVFRSVFEITSSSGSKKDKQI